MEYTMQQWRDQQHQSDQQPSAKIPKLVLEQQEQQHQLSGSALSLSVLEPNSKSCCNLSAFPDSTAARFPRMGGFFSLAQWHELELQALIFKYMLAGASVPLDLVLLIKKSLLNTPAYYPHLHHHQQYQHFRPAMLQSLQTGYWGRTLVDAEPGRCRRTDGKKWRCSRDVVTGQKYCERHMHRGRNRSRKPVEIPTPTVTGGRKSTVTTSSSNAAKETHFTLSGPPLPPSNDLLHLNQRSSDSITEIGSHIYNHHHNIAVDEGGSDSRVLRHFFDDWPRSQQDSSSATSSNASPATSSTHLSISTPGNPSSDFSLKLSTGIADEMGPGGASVEERRTNWTTGWGTRQEASMGGPLAEVLRSSTSSSPTSVLHKSYGSIPEASSICT